MKKFKGRIEKNASRHRFWRRGDGLEIFLLFVEGPRIKPGTSGLGIRRSNQLSYPAIWSEENAVPHLRVQSYSEKMTFAIPLAILS